MKSSNNKLGTTWHQQVFALDGKYNSQRASNHHSLGLLYMRRRSQLLQEKQLKDPVLQNHYLKIRSELLRRRYGVCPWAYPSAETISLMSSERSFEMKSKKSRSSSLKPSAVEGFVGVHHVFDQHSAAVSCIKFAHDDRSRFCCASHDGTISICEAATTPPKIVVLLQGHSKGVTAVEWSMSNDLLVSCSLDATIRLWKMQSDSKAQCLRVVGDQLKSECLCCAFVPANNNFVVAGNSQGLLQILNVSTGKFAKGGTVKIGGKVTSLTCEESGRSLIWAGNDRGKIVSYRLETGTGRLSKLRRMEGAGGIVTSLSWRPWLSKDFPWPTLLVSSTCNAVLLFRVSNDQGYLVLWKKYPVRHRQHYIKSTFCPQMGTCLIATGSEDGSVNLLDCTRDGKSAKLNRLLGHSAPTLALCFNYDESLLATGDNQGLVILWRNNQCQLRNC